MGYYVGIDLGGTSVKAGLVDDLGHIVGKASAPTPAEDGPERVAQVMVQLARRVALDAGIGLGLIEGIGVGVPGPVDADEGVVHGCANLQGWANVPLRAMITRAIGLPVIVENDANVAAYGEYRVAAQTDPTLRHLLLMTLGTGIGGGLVLDGKVFRGGAGMAGEIGHMIVWPGGRPCGCGQLGCIEAYASASAILQRTREAIAAGERSALAGPDGLLPPGTTTKDVFGAAAAGDPLADRILYETAEYLGVGCINMARIVDAQQILFGGGLAAAGKPLIDRIRDAYNRLSWHVTDAPPVIDVARLGNDAGFVGAAALAADAAEPARHPAPRP